MSDRVVWVVTGNYADDPHPHVLGVYDNEDAADEHVRAIRESIKPSEPIAYGHQEVPLNSEPVRERQRKPVPDGGTEVSGSYRSAPDDLDVYRGENRLAAMKRWIAEQQEGDDDE